MPFQLPTLTPDYAAPPTVPTKVLDALTGLTAFGNALEGRVLGLHSQVTNPALAPKLTTPQLKQVVQSLQATGGTPLVVTGLPGAGGNALIVGTHAQRLILAPFAGANFYETDRHALYSAGIGVWTLSGSCPAMEVSGIATLPGDLGSNDAAFYAFDQTTGVTWLWSGAVWHWHQGTQYGPIANRPVAFTACDAGVIWVATDQGDQAWELDYGIGAWVLIKGCGGPMVGVLSGKPTLGVNDAGFTYAATDFDREYTWNGSAWGDSPGQPMRGMICNFTAGPSAAWAQCNGGAATSSTAAGGTQGITTPNLIGQFIHENSSSGGTGSAVNINYQTGATNATDVNYTDLIPYIRL
jgi:hypothetical protein